MVTLRYFIVVALFLFFQITLSAQNVSPQFSELKGMEDAQGNTHLLYRIYSNYEDSYNSSGSNNIYNLILGTSTDTIFLYDGYYCNNWTGGSGLSITSYDFWNKDLSKHIYCGDEGNCFEATGYISRFDSQFVRIGLFESYGNLSISKQNDSLIYAAYPVLKSTDGGFNWIKANDSLRFQSLSPFNDQIFFATGTYYWWGGSYLYKTNDGGNTFTIVDTGGNDWFSNFYYDLDENHIYREHSTGYPNRSLKASANQGNAFSWQSIYSTNNNFYICLDESQSGAIYLADGKRIIRSADYGNTFTPYKELDKRIIGIYKKPNSNKLYAATKYRIYEIINDTVSVIKSLPIPDELLSFYPLKVGNKWIYNYSFVDWNMGGDVDIYYREVLSGKIKPNGKEYFEIIEKYVYMGIVDTVYERIDSVEGKIYRYQTDCPNSEQLIEDLVMEVGDSTYATRFGYCIEHPPTELLSEQYFNKWEIEGMRRNYNYMEFFTVDYFLASGIGLDYIKLSDDNGDKIFILKGMIKDGTVYGDTTLTDVTDENELPKEFSLQQNYPNPFNPSTKISWQSPIGAWQTLKVYDALGSEVATLVNEYKPAGSYEVEFLSPVGSHQLASGIYFYQLKAGEFVETKKMIYLK